jgi:hypothetical protein
MRPIFENKSQFIIILQAVLMKPSVEDPNLETGPRNGVAGLVDRLFPKRAARRLERNKALLQQMKSDRQKLSIVLGKAMIDGDLLQQLILDPEAAVARLNLSIGDYGMQILKYVRRSALENRYDRGGGDEDSFVDFW